ncbi:sugar phosphate isomerase/epimerase family protein [Cerasicoccus frondis]|uniref:sugar phosphate isomerase/epimerase family protein n=1 Tax=Cerasicoccus frondis TaxID=490090 RepID=UPI002852C344|nr:TIM barrel protein [Cerasicoccus frondis]
MKTKLSDVSPLAWCFSSMGCQELTLPEIAALAREHGVGQIELRAVGDQIDIPAHAAEARWLDERAEKLLGGNDVAIAGFNSSAKLSQPFEEAAREITAFAPLLEHFGAVSLRVFDGALDASVGWDGVWRWLDAWEALREANDWCFSLAIETHDSLLSPENIALLFSRGHQHIGLLWDSHHTWKKAGSDPLATWEFVRQWTTHIHVKDSISRASARHPYTYVLPGEGEFPLMPLLDRLARDRFAGPVSLEWERLWHPYMPSLDAALDAMGKLLVDRRDSTCAKRAV